MRNRFGVLICILLALSLALCFLSSCSDAHECPHVDINDDNVCDLCESAYFDGKTAYELYCENNPEYTGTEEEWLASLKGKSAYEIYCTVYPDYDGTEEEWLETLKGKSAYELYCEENPDYEGTEEEWLETLKGKSAYELYCESHPDYTGSEEEWLNDLVNDELGTVEHTVTFVTGYNGHTFTQTVKHGEKLTWPTEYPAELGYKIVAWDYSNEYYTERWSFAGHVVTEDMTLTAVWGYATDELPIVNIDTNGAPIPDKINYVDMTFSIENCDNELFGIEGGIRLRGNTTSTYDKKPYRIKFDSSQSLFGLEKAKSWVLLADYLDPSALHNHAALTMGNDLDGLSFTPTPNKVNVYLNGEYIGLYTLCEQVQENKGRIDIELDEITETLVDLKDYNFFICMDYNCTKDPEAVLNETYFYISEYDRYFELKYPEKGDFPSEAQFNSFLSQLKAYVKDIMDAFANKDLDTLYNEVNLNSLADFLIIDQIMGEQDHASKSFNMYYTNTSDDEDVNGKLNFGPIWDYDWALRTPWTGRPNSHYQVSDVVAYSNLFFITMAQTPELFEIVKERYTLYGEAAIADYIEGFDELYRSMEESLALNQKRWYDGIATDLTDKNVQFLKDSLITRKAVLDGLYLIEHEE